MKLVLSTRQSPLALWQAEEAKRLLEQAQPGIEVSLLPVSASGDQDQTTALSRFGRIGIFTAEVDRALLERRADLGVHSLKDLTTEIERGLCLAGVLPRGPVEDALITMEGRQLADLDRGASVATSSQRRKAQLLAVRPDLKVVEIRGNVQTRLKQLEEGNAQGLLMARAGLLRLGLEDRISEILPLETFLPAASQGIIGLTARIEDDAVQELGQALAQDGTNLRATAERTFLNALEAGCTAPVGIHCTVAGDKLCLRAQILSLDGSRQLVGEAQGTAADPRSLGLTLAQDLLDQGAAELVAEARQ